MIKNCKKCKLEDVTHYPSCPQRCKACENSRVLAYKQQKAAEARVKKANMDSSNITTEGLDQCQK